jgi:hypothetical protein
MGFEPTISARERSQTYALDRTAAGTGILKYCVILYRMDVTSHGRIFYEDKRSAGERHMEDGLHGYEDALLTPTVPITRDGTGTNAVR